MAFVIASFTTGWRNAHRYWKTLFSYFSAYWTLRAASDFVVHIGQGRDGFTRQSYRGCGKTNREKGD